jgi:hypothetical protein
MKFYYRGGSKVVAIYKEESGNFAVYIPSFSLVETKEVFTLIDGLKREIDLEMERCQIVKKEVFLFNTTEKKIVEKGSFYEYASLSNLKYCLWIMDTEIPEDSKKVFTLMDRSNYGIIQFACLMIAKTQLIRPFEGKWTLPGKQILSYLLAKRFNIPMSFEYASGPWDLQKIELPDDSKASRIDLTKMKTSRLLELANKVAMEESNWVQKADKDESQITLGDVLEAGVDSFFNNTYTGIIKISLDMCVDRYKSVTIDTQANICFVELQPGIEISDTAIKEELNSENVQITQIVQNVDGESNE